MTPPVGAPRPPETGEASEYDTLAGLLHAYRTPVAIILFGIMVSLVLFFATLVGQTREKERAFRSYAAARIVELDGAMATLDVELRQLTQAVHSGLSPREALAIFEAAEVAGQIPVVRDMGIVESGALTGSLNPDSGRQLTQAINALVARDAVGREPVVLPLLDENDRHSRFALVQALEGDTPRHAYVVSQFDVMLASPVGPVDPLWVVINLSDRAPTHALAGNAPLRIAGSRAELDIDTALDSAPYLVRWVAPAPFDTIRATLLPRRSFLMQTGALPWVVLISALFATLTIGAISLKDARRADEVRREVARKTEALRQSNAIIAAKNAELDRFAAHASHDLQAPLRAMKGFSTFLVERQLDLDDRSRDMLERINRGADRAQRLVQDLLTYTRADRQEARIEALDPEALKAEVEELLSAVIAEADASLDWRFDTDLHGDRFLIVRMLQNLIANAIKYRREDNPQVQIHARRKGNKVLLSVSDNGIGIEPAYFKRIFEVFERLHGGERYEGSGIGLALCQRAAELHGGDITVTSEPGQGSCFTIRLPANLAEAVPPDDSDAPPKRAASNDR